MFMESANHTLTTLQFSTNIYSADAFYIIISRDTVMTTYIIYVCVCVCKLISLIFKSYIFQMFYPKDGGRPPKHVGGMIVCFLYVYFIRANC